MLHGDGSNTVAKKGGDGIGYSGHKHQKGEKIIVIVENNRYILAPFPVASVNVNDCILLPDSLKELMRITRSIGVSVKGSLLNLDGVFDSRNNRKSIFNRGMVPNIPENMAIESGPRRDRSASSMPPATSCGSWWSARSPGRTGSSACCFALSASSHDTWASNGLPMR